MDISVKELALRVMKGECQRSFYLFSEAHYAKYLRETPYYKDIVDDLMLGVNHSIEGGTYGEFCVEWKTLGSNVAAQLKVFDDTWVVLPLFKDVLDWLPSQTTPHNRDAITPKAFTEKLIELGFVDKTKRVPKEDEYAPPVARKVRSHSIVTINPAFSHLFDPVWKYIVPFSGGVSLDQGCVLSIQDMVEKWLSSNCEGDFEIQPNDIMFENESDAIICQMRFS